MTQPIHSAKSIYKATSKANYGVKPSAYNQQTGMALLTILLIVVAITVVAGSMMASQSIMIRQYDLLRTQDQLLQDIKAGEQLAVDLIQVEAQVNDTDSLEDAWAQPQPPFELGQHQISILIRDEASRFNLNNLYHDGTTDEIALGVLQRLLTQLGLDAELAFTLVDWQDPDNELSKGEGSEAELYATDGITIANQPFLSVDSLSQVSGFDNETITILKPYVTAVPYYLPINVNTADVILLSALTEGSNGGSNDNGDSQNTQNDLASIYQDQSERRIFNNVEEYIATLPQLSPDNADSNNNNNSNNGSDGSNDEDNNPSITDEEKQAEANQAGKNKEGLAQLLSVDSGAFAVLIDVTVDDKHRYATSFVSKVKMTSSQDNGNNEADSQSNNLDSNSQNEQENNPRIIQSFGSRLWTYRPYFEP